MKNLHPLAEKMMPKVSMWDHKPDEERVSKALNTDKDIEALEKSFEVPDGPEFYGRRGDKRVTR